MVQAELKARGIQLMVGRQFWAFLSGDERCMDELLDLARAAAEEAPPGETSFSDRVDEKVVRAVDCVQGTVWRQPHRGRVESFPC